MNADPVEQVANAVLYEGYLLYPYRKSAVKNRQRFNFGVLYPPRFCTGSDTSQMLSEFLIAGGADAALQLKLRFLQLVDEQGLERSVEIDFSIADLLEGATRQKFTFGEEIAGTVEMSAAPAGENLFRITLRACNTSPFEGSEREQAIAKSLVSLHGIACATGGQFVSLLEPPDYLRGAAQACRNQGVWPVLAGEPGSRDTILISPIILYDYPQIAPESPGDFFDGTEIDELLALRVLTMTDEEKREMREGDERARQILERTENLPQEHFEKLHGALRGMQTVSGAKHE